MGVESYLSVDVAGKRFGQLASRALTKVANLSEKSATAELSEWKLFTFMATRHRHEPQSFKQPKRFGSGIVLYPNENALGFVV